MESKAIYTNHVQISMQLLDFTLSLNLMRANGNSEEQAVVYMSPQHAKALLNVLYENVKMYESLYGPINLEANQEQVDLLAAQGKIQVAAGKEN